MMTVTTKRTEAGFRLPLAAATVLSVLALVALIVPLPGPQFLAVALVLLVISVRRAGQLLLD